MRYPDFKTFTRQATLPLSTNDTGEIYRSAVSILDTIRLRKSVRLFGISLSSLSKGEDQLPLFVQPDNDKKAALAKAVDAVNDKFGEHTVTHASTLAQERGQRVISPAWRPSGVRKSDVWVQCSDGPVVGAATTNPPANAAWSRSMESIDYHLKAAAGPTRREHA